MAPSELIYEAACQSGRKTPMDPDPPFGLWGWSKTYIPKTAYQVGQQRVLHGPNGTSLKVSSQAEEDAAVAQGWSVGGVERVDVAEVTAAEAQASELAELKQQVRLQAEMIDRLIADKEAGGKRGKREKPEGE